MPLDHARERMGVIAEEIFGTEQDPNQIPITQESRDKLDALSPHWLVSRLDKNGEPISWWVVVPTTKAIARSFLDGEIVEREILELTQPQPVYDALYLCAAITVPAYRRQGIALQLAREAVLKNPLTPDALIFAWPYTEEGRLAAEAVSKALGRTIELRTH